MKKKKNDEVRGGDVDMNIKSTDKNNQEKMMIKILEHTFARKINQ